MGDRKQQGGKINTLDEKQSQSYIKLSNITLFEVLLESYLIDEKEALQIWNDNEPKKFLEGILKEEEYFIKEVRDGDKPFLIKLFDNIVAVMKDNRSLFDIIFKLKRLIRAANSMNTSLILTEAIEKVIDETCSCLSCDRSTVFMLDTTRGELWSKVAKGAQTIRVPWNTGIAGRNSHLPPKEI